MLELPQRLHAVQRQIAEYARRYGRDPASVRLLAVSKTQPLAALRQAVAAGQRCFGENYLQEALPKIQALAAEALEWHFIGPLQSNKTRAIAENFAWVHTLDQLKHAQRLSAQRPASLPPLNVCIQVNLSREPQKAGIEPRQLMSLAQALAELPRLRLRGLMALPAPAEELTLQRQPFQALRRALEDLQAAGMELDTLSMGMSGDMEAAIAEGATLVRIGTAIFGPRQ